MKMSVCRASRYFCPDSRRRKRQTSARMDGPWARVRFALPPDSLQIRCAMNKRYSDVRTCRRFERAPLLLLTFQPETRHCHERPVARSTQSRIAGGGLDRTSVRASPRAGSSRSSTPTTSSRAASPASPNPPSSSRDPAMSLDLSLAAALGVQRQRAHALARRLRAALPEVAEDETFWDTARSPLPRTDRRSIRIGSSPSPTSTPRGGWCTKGCGSRWSTLFLHHREPASERSARGTDRFSDRTRRRPRRARRSQSSPFRASSGAGATEPATCGCVVERLQSIFQWRRHAGPLKSR